MEVEARLDAQSGSHAPHQLQLRSQVSLYALYTHDNQKKRILMFARGGVNIKIAVLVVEFSVQGGGGGLS